MMLVITSSLILLLGLVGRYTAMQEDSYPIWLSIVLDLLTLAGVIGLATAFWMRRKRKKQDQQLEQARQEARRVSSEPRQGVPRRRDSG